MKKIIALFLITLLMVLQCSCSRPSSDEKPDSELDETSKIAEQKIADICSKYNAVDFEQDVSYDSYTVDILDNYRGRAIYTDAYDITDIYYQDGEKYLLCDSFSGFFALRIKINDEQYAFIKSIDDPEDVIWGMVFTLDDVLIFQPRIQTEFYAEIFEDSYDLDGSFSAETYFDKRIIEGTLLDMITPWEEE